MNLCALESYTMRLAACWDGELDAIGAYSQLAYLHEKAHGAEEAAAEIREAIERLIECLNKDAAGHVLSGTTLGPPPVSLRSVGGASHARSTSPPT